jgi:hypothetical protein
MEAIVSQADRRFHYVARTASQDVARCPLAVLPNGLPVEFDSPLVCYPQFLHLTPEDLLSFLSYSYLFDPEIVSSSNANEQRRPLHIDRDVGTTDILLVNVGSAIVVIQTPFLHTSRHV